MYEVKRTFGGFAVIKKQLNFEEEIKVFTGKGAKAAATDYADHLNGHAEFEKVPSYVSQSKTGKTEKTGRGQAARGSTARGR